MLNRSTVRNWIKYRLTVPKDKWARKYWTVENTLLYAATTLIAWATKDSFYLLVAVVALIVLTIYLLSK